MKACRTCRYIVETEKVCPKCQGELTEKFHGIIVILDPEKSEIAKITEINSVGRYAIKVK
ncbi:MAG: transcription elongation factor subunit Spt4 [Candidatus Micrarchaeota archaeon]